MNLIRLFLTAFAISIFLYTCKNENVALKADDLPSYTLSPNTSNGIGVLDPHIDNLRTIELSAEVSNQLGVIFGFFVMDNSDLIVFDSNSAIITRLNEKGDIVWQIKPRDDDFHYHDAIEKEVVYDKANERILVANHYEIYAYGLDGQPKGPVKTFDLFTRGFMSFPNGDLLHVIRGASDLDGEAVDRQLIWTRGIEIKNTFIGKRIIPPNKSTVGGFPLFSKWGGELYYHAAFMDTFYRVDLPEVYPEFTFRFDLSMTTQDAMEDPMITNAFSYAIKRNIPMLYRSAANKEKVALIYNKHEVCHLALIDRTTKAIELNHYYLRYNEMTFKAPVLIHDGYLLGPMPKHEVDHYAKIPPGTKTVSSDWIAEMKDLNANYTDSGPVTLYLIKL